MFEVWRSKVESLQTPAIISSSHDVVFEDESRKLELTLELMRSGMGKLEGWNFG